MKSVFEASTALEAHMILNLLQQEGIAGQVEGEYLQGGLGELQPLNLVRVVVAEADYQRARSILADWEARQPQPEARDSRRGRATYTGRAFFLGLLAGVGGMYWAYHSPTSEQGVDYNRDGMVDEKWTYVDDRLARTEVDRNRDGEVDLVHRFDRRGIVYKTDMDNDFDGRFETQHRYQHGNLHLSEADVDQDGDIDYRARFEHGVLDEIELIDADAGVVRKKQRYSMDKLESAEYDADGDGIADVSYEYDFYEEVTRQARVDGRKPRAADTDR